MCEGASKHSQDLKNYTAPGPRPPVLKLLDPPLVVKWKNRKFTTKITLLNRKTNIDVLLLEVSSNIETMPLLTLLFSLEVSDLMEEATRCMLTVMAKDIREHPVTAEDEMTVILMRNSVKRNK